MAPKSQPSKKTEEKVKQKVIDDKTFGLKNKNKSSKVNKYIQQVEQQVKSSGNRKIQKEDGDLKKQREIKKLEEQKKAAELSALFKPIVLVQKVAFGVDPKTVLCINFKSDQCQKGDKCKFSHDLNIERKSTKINLYEDIRDGKSNPSSNPTAEDDKMENWDQSKLQDVVAKKHGSHDNDNRHTTEIVCKYFIEAIEQKKYGWFWECPNGGDKCKYRHALPPNFVLKSLKNDSEENEEEKITIEEFLETERYKIEKITPVTEESFAKWKVDRKKKTELELLKKQNAKEADIKAGRLLHVSGRDLFTYRPELAEAEGSDDEVVDYQEERHSDIEDEEEDDEAFDEEEEEELDQVIDTSVFLDEDLADLEIVDDE